MPAFAEHFQGTVSIENLLTYASVNKNTHCTWTETSLKVSGRVAEL